MKELDGMLKKLQKASKKSIDKDVKRFTITLSGNGKVVQTRGQIKARHWYDYDGSRTGAIVLDEACIYREGKDRNAWEGYIGPFHVIFFLSDDMVGKTVRYSF